MTDLNQLKLVHALAETAYMKAVGEAPPVRARSPACQYHLDRLCDAMQRASKEYRDAERAAWWEKRDAEALEAKRAFPHILGGE